MLCPRLGGCASRAVHRSRRIVFLVALHDTFVRVFPYGVSLPGMLIGSAQPVGGHFRRAGIDIEQLVRQYLTRPSPRFGRGFDRTTLTDITTDLFPKDEFDRSRPDRTLR